MRKIVLLSAVNLMFAAMLTGTPAQAQTRTWVSSTGSGVTCSRTLPCATFQAAHDANASGGEINCVDAGEFASGAMSITKSITIDCGGSFGAIKISNININGAGIVVRLRNLSFNGLSSFGTNAIDFVNGAALYVENCTIFGYQGLPLRPGHPV